MLDPVGDRVARGLKCPAFENEKRAVYDITRFLRYELTSQVF
jgi:hypothetical protein